MFNGDFVEIPNGYGYSAAAIGRFYVARTHGVTLPYTAAVIMLLLDAGCWRLKAL